MYSNKLFASQKAQINSGKEIGAVVHSVGDKMRHEICGFLVRCESLALTLTLSVTVAYISTTAGIRFMHLSCDTFAIDERSRAFAGANSRAARRETKAFRKGVVTCWSKQADLCSFADITMDGNIDVTHQMLGGGTCTQERMTRLLIVAGAVDLNSALAVL